MNGKTKFMDKESLIKEISRILDDKKAENIEVFNIDNTDYITECVVIATSMIDKHGLAMLDSLKTELKLQDVEFYGTDEENGDWIIVDLGNVMVHLFTESHRKRFNLEAFLKEIQYKKK